MITMNAHDELKKKGFVVIPNLVSQAQCDRVLENTCALLRHYADSPVLSAEKPWLNQEFHDYLGTLRKADPKLFGAIYDSASASVALTGLLVNDEVNQTVAELLDVIPAWLTSSGYIQRMDAPEDTRNLYDYHQDRPYYPQNRNGENAVVVWIPLMDVPLDGGALTTLEGSHVEGYLKTKGEQPTEFHSTQYHIPDEIIAKYKPASIPTKAGDGLFMYMTTIHKSGLNHTNLFRFVAIARYHNAVADDFVPYRVQYKFNKLLTERLAERGEDVSDLL